MPNWSLTSPRIFLLTPLREGRPAYSQKAKNHIIFLLTPLREGRLKETMRYCVNREISTHAPAGGAT